jgi:hypothetical protein
MYSTPKYKANIVSVRTNIEATKAKESIQNTKCESIKSRQKNHLPKSTNVYVPLINKLYISIAEKNSTNENDIREA